MEVFYANGTAYSVVSDDLSPYQTITKEALVQAGELKITFTFHVGFGRLLINSTKLLPAPCGNMSASTRMDHSVMKGTWYLLDRIMIIHTTPVSENRNIVLNKITTCSLW